MPRRNVKFILSGVISVRRHGHCDNLGAIISDKTLPTTPLDAITLGSPARERCVRFELLIFLDFDRVDGPQLRIHVGFLCGIYVAHSLHKDIS